MPQLSSDRLGEPRIKQQSAEVDALAREIQKLSAELAREHDQTKLKTLRGKRWFKRQRLADLRSGLTVWELDMAVATVLVSRFFAPLQINFGGRINPVPFFDFTRPDHIRALFRFANGEPIGEEGLFYPKVHLAACADGNGWSKIERPGNLDFDGRAAWVDEHLSELRSIGEAVLRGDDPATLDWALLRPSEADAISAKPSGDLVSVSDPPPAKGISDPYQFIAACVELTQALELGPSFVTRRQACARERL
jgi:DNA-directed RNA polymerase